MTECTGRRYWLKRIRDTRERYNAWSKIRAPIGAPRDQWLAWSQWRDEYLNYLHGLARWGRSTKE